MAKEKGEAIFDEAKKNDVIHITSEDEKWIYAEISKDDFRAGKAPLGSMV